MRDPATSSKVRYLGQVAVVALLAGLTAGCSTDVSRFGSLFDATDNRNNIVTGSIPKPAPTTPGQLPAPVNPGGNWSAAGGTPITVGQGETLQTLATRYGVPTEALAMANGLPATALLSPGQKLVIPTWGAAQQAATSAIKPVEKAATQAIDTATAAGEAYVIKPGDSLGKLANARGLRLAELAKFNGLDPYAPIKIGQKIKFPTSAKEVAALATQTLTDAAPPLPSSKKPAAPADAAPAATAATVTPTPPAAPGDKPAEPPPAKAAAVSANPPKPQLNTGTGVESASSGSFRWPIRGRVISAYGVKANGERNDGINIEAPEGTPIKAAEGGTVIYAGNELKGYGYLVLVKHPNGFVSAYAHASEILVQRDDTVMRGQTIAKVGSTGGVPRPQLHFELRKGNKPIDPLPFLSG